MSEPTPSAPPEVGAPPHPTAVIVHLSGDFRGKSQRLAAETLVLGTAPNADVFLLAHEDLVGPHHATLVRQGETYELRVTPGWSVWVNGARVETRILESGDMLEIGAEGPVLRFRLYEPGSRAYKSAREAFADCVDCARLASQTALGRTGLFLAGMPKELATQTSVGFRAAVVVALAVLLGGMGMLTHRSFRLEERLESETVRLQVLAEVVETADDRLTDEDLRQLRSELEGRLTETVERVESLEARAEAVARIIAMASGSIVFLQGSYGFLEPVSRLPFRLLGVDENGQPLTNDQGDPVVTVEGEGPVLERLYTGTAFVATEDGLLVTNRHVGLPWEDDEAARAAVQQGIIPAMRRLVGYLPGVDEPFDVRVVVASDTSDLAVLRCSQVTTLVAPLMLREDPARRGEEVVVLGYPTGMQALLARSDPDLVTELMAERDLDFWSVAHRLSEAGQIGALATRGIVGQVTASAVVYDAQTTFGGSGGPVLDLDGRVVAVNSAILAGFGGSNMGVPAAEARRLLEQAFKEEAALPKP
jgi:serine protease Do